MMIDVHRANHRPGTLNYLRDRLRISLSRMLGDGIGDCPVGGLRFAFVVGCGHSGTSLIASRLGLHHACHLIDGETLAFSPSRTRWSCKRSIRTWMNEARASGRSIVVEKTPKHIHSLARIRHFLPGAQFVAVSRNPLDTVASLKKRFGSLELAIERWNMDNAVLACAMRDRDVLHVCYDELTRSPEAGFRRVTDFLGTNWDPDVLASGKTGYTDAKRMFAERLQQVAQPVVHRVDRWREILSGDEAESVMHKTRPTAALLGYSTSWNGCRVPPDTQGNMTTSDIQPR